jgi:Na+/glutamate symporter
MAIRSFKLGQLFILLVPVLVVVVVVVVTAGTFPNESDFVQ